jgi:HEPN domain-containing protein
MSEPGAIPSTLLALAADDEFMARSLLPIEGVTDAGLGFHTQQAVEKALKSVLAFKGVEFPFTHDLEGLLSLCRKSGIDVPEDMSEVDRLSVFAVRLRYDASPAAHLDRDQALRWAAAAVEWAQEIVGQPEPRQRNTAERAAEGTPEQE